jgi:hypothetical protein
MHALALLAAAIMAIVTPIFRCCNSTTTFGQVLDFYGFDMHGGGQIFRGANYRQRCRVWLSPGNDHLHRITRILKQLDRETAQSFFEVLGDIYLDEGKKVISHHVFHMWREAALTPQGVAQIRYQQKYVLDAWENQWGPRNSWKKPDLNWVNTL